MNFEWDERKRLTNIRKHAIDFEDCPPAFDGTTVTIEDHGFHHGEQRFKTLGFVRDRLVSIIHTERRGVIRLISGRKASTNEQVFFNKALGN